MTVGNAPPSEEARLLGELSELRRRVRDQHREHALWAALVGLVALGGAVSFLLAPQIREVTCQRMDAAAVVCGSGQRSFLLWWYWPLAGAAALVFALVRRHRRGTWRMSPVGWVILTIVSVLVLAVAVPLLPSMAPPVAYPLAMAAVLAAVAVGRRSVLGVGAVLAAVGGILVIESSLTRLAVPTSPSPLLRHNLGWALGSVTVAVAALVAASLWTVHDRR